MTMPYDNMGYGNVWDPNTGSSYGAGRGNQGMFKDPQGQHGDTQNLYAMLGRGPNQFSQLGGGHTPWSEGGDPYGATGSPYADTWPGFPQRGRGRPMPPQQWMGDQRPGAWQQGPMPPQQAPTGMDGFPPWMRGPMRGPMPPLQVGTGNDRPQGWQQGPMPPQYIGSPFQPLGQAQPIPFGQAGPMPAQQTPSWGIQQPQSDNVRKQRFG